MGFNSGLKGLSNLNQTPLTALNKHPFIYLVIKQRQNGGEGGREKISLHLIQHYETVM
jgi:hypothetical protein